MTNELTVRHLEVVMGLIKQDDKYLFQLRNGKNQAGGIGLIGCFGGQIEEDDDSPEAAVCREVSEETTLNPITKDLIVVGAVDVESERNSESITVHAQIFKIEVGKNIKVGAREGELVSMTEEQVYNSLDKLTPATRAYFEQIHKEK